MLVKDVELLNNHKFNISKRSTKKTQILLYDTKRRTADFLSKLVYRNNQKYNDIPHYVVTKLGDVIPIIDTKYFSHTFDNPDIDKHLIKIAIENLGWLNKNTITGFLNNWIGDPFRSEPYMRGWRDFYFWDKYEETQIKSIVQLCITLCKEHDIPYKIVPSQGYLENVSKFRGIACKSNYSNIYTDINPSFNFKLFNENEKENNSI